MRALKGFGGLIKKEKKKGFGGGDGEVSFMQLDQIQAKMKIC